MTDGVRDLVSASWRRSVAADVDPERGLPPLVYARREVAELRAGHPLAEAFPLLQETLVRIADEAEHMMVVTDAQGLVLWREGHRTVLHRAEDTGLVEGTRWSEETIGTNAVGTALAEDRALQIHAGEHHVRAYHYWTCAAAPIHSPDTGEVIGIVDVTGPATGFHPTTLALVNAAAKLAEKHLEARAALRDERLLSRNLPHLLGLGDQAGALLSPHGRVLAAQPDGWVREPVDLGPAPTDGMRVALGPLGEGVVEQLAEGYLLRLRRAAPRRASLALRFLGGDRPHARLDGRRIRLSLRHAELLTLLVLHPDGLTADGLAALLYGDTGKAVTIRAEMHRLRLQLTPGLVRTQPYRLDAAVEADFQTVHEALRAGRVRDAAALHRGELLPASEAPAVREERDSLAVAVRSAVLRSADVEALWSYQRTELGRLDPEASEHLHSLLPPGDPRRSLMEGEIY